VIYSALKRALLVLDEHGFETFGEEWDEMVIDQIATMSGRYGNLTDATRDLQDYSAFPAGVGYLFMYAAGHAELVACVLEKAHSACGHPTFNKQKLRVASIGGGPGSELLGLIKFLHEHQPDSLPEKIVYTVYDKEAGWEHIAAELAESIETTIEIVLKFRPLDVTGDCAAVTLEKQDLVMMSFFISEVSNLPKAAEVREALKHLLGTIPADSYLLYNDNSNMAFYGYLNSRRKSAGKFDEVYDSDPHHFDVPVPDLDGIFEEMIERFERTPKLSAFALSKLLVRVK